MSRELGPAASVDRSMTSLVGYQWRVQYPESHLDVLVTMRPVFGELEIVDLEIRSTIAPGSPEVVYPGDQPTIITAELLRKIPLSKLKAACLTDLDEWRDYKDELVMEAIRETPKRGQPSVPLVKLKRTANLYLDAVKHLQNPIKRIEEEMSVKPS